jgi:LAO/AO transport system kinase
MVDFFLLIQLTGAGDELQGIKRGIMEMADGIAINKCDGSNIEKARVAKSQYQNALHLFPPHDSGWSPEAITCSSVELNGIPEVWNMVERYIEFVKSNGYFEIKRNSQSKYWMYETINEQLKANFYQNPEIQSSLIDSEKKVLSNELSSFIAAKKLLDHYFGGME